MTDSGRPGEGAAIEARETIMRHTSMTRPRCDEVLDAFAAAVRAEHGETIAQAIEQEMSRGNYSDAVIDALRAAARLAREASK